MNVLKLFLEVMLQSKSLEFLFKEGRLVEMSSSGYHHPPRLARYYCLI